MREIGENIILNWKHENYRIIPDNQWAGHIKCQIVFLRRKDEYLVRNKWGYEFFINELDILK